MHLKLYQKRIMGIVFNKTSKLSTPIILQNTRSIFKKLLDFEVLTKQQEIQPLALCLTEKWLKNGSNTKCILLDDYQEITRSNKKASKGVGVGIFVRKAEKQTSIKKS